jgi:hypothetical protein
VIAGDLRDLPVVRQALAGGDPVLQYKARLWLLEEPPDSARLKKLRAAIGSSPRARSLLAGRLPDGTIGRGPYRKWQGPHWTLYSLALIDYPAGDRALRPLRDQVYDWLLDPAHLEFRQSLLLPGQEDRFRRCASQEGNAIWYSIRLGIDDERTRELVRRLCRWQWPDGGWNCDKRPQARTSSVIETLIPLRALSLAASRYGDRGAGTAARRAAEFFLARRLFRRLRDGRPIREDFFRIQYPVQFYDILFALTVMAEIGKLRDPRCREALELLAAKQCPDGGFPLEACNATTSDRLITRGSRADWGPKGKTRTNPLVSLEALRVLKAAGRYAG